MSRSFSERLRAMKQTSFTFTSFERKTATLKDGETEKSVYLVLKLEHPIAEVTGSITEHDPYNPEHRLVRKAYDVQEVKVNIDLLDFDKDFTFEEDDKENFTGNGAYTGDADLDVSEKLEVWLTYEKFSAFSWKQRKRQQSERFGKKWDQRNGDKG